MITDESKTRLMQIYKTIRDASPAKAGGWWEIDDQVLLGSIVAAFHLGQAQVGKEIIEATANLGQAKASPTDERAGDAWAMGYLEAGNDLLEIFGAKFDDLKSQISSTKGLTELATLTDPNA